MTYDDTLSLLHTWQMSALSYSETRHQWQGSQPLNHLDAALMLAYPNLINT